MVHGSSSYCVSNKIGSKYDDEAGQEYFDEYWAQLKYLLSNYLIECAVKIRMVQEFCGKEDSYEVLARYEEKAVESLSLGRVIEGGFNLTLRETTNKIIHSTSAKIEFSDIESDGDAYKAWDGKYHLYGSHGKSDWHVELCVENWAKTMSTYLDVLADDEKIFYMGQDWS